MHCDNDNDKYLLNWDSSKIRVWLSNLLHLCVCDKSRNEGSHIRGCRPSQGWHATVKVGVGDVPSESMTSTKRRVWRINKQLQPFYLKSVEIARSTLAWVKRISILSELEQFWMKLWYLTKQMCKTTYCNQPIHTFLFGIFVHNVKKIGQNFRLL